MRDWLFVYGTLLPGRAPAEVAEVVGEFELLGKGTVRGRVYELGEYPGLVLDEHAGAVEGMVFSVPDREDVWRLLDAYEEYVPERPEESLFVRRRVRVEMEDGGRCGCWVYVYNGAVEEAFRL